MGTKYPTILVGGVVQTYNDSPPSDDGSQTEANRVKYSTVTGDLSAPLHSAITRMDAAILAQVDEGPTTKSGAFTTTAAEHNQVIECTGTITISLLNPTGNAGYQTTVKNAGSGTVTVDVDGGANIDGGASVDLTAGEARKVYVNDAGTAYYSAGQVGTGFVAGTEMLFYQDAAPTGWTITQAVDEHAVRLTKGSGADGQAGGAIGGTNNFSTQFANLAEGATPGVGDHTLTEAECPDFSIQFYTEDVSATSCAGLSHIWGNSGFGSPANTSGTGSYVTQDNGSSDLAQFPNNSGNAHGHTVDLRVKWAACIVAAKD